MANIEFNLDSSAFAEEGYVYRKGLIFRAGQYSDKGFEMTPEELLTAANEFEPVPLDVEHIPSIFDSKLGSLLAVEPSDDGWELYGVAKIPKWLNDIHGENEPIKVSCTWQRDTKKLNRLALVRNPRVGDAALMAAFTANEIQSSTSEDHFKDTVLKFLQWFSTNDAEKSGEFGGMMGESPGSFVLQSIHNMCAHSGAICDPTNVEVEEDEEDENEGKGENGNGYKSYRPIGFVSKKESDTFQRIHDLVIKQGAKCYPEKDFNTNNTNTQKEDSTMASLKDLIKSITTLSAALPESVLDTPVVSPEATPAPAVEHSDNVDELEKLKAELSAAQEKLNQVEAEKAQVEAEKAQAEQELLNSEANEFAENLIQAKKITPASSEFARKLYLVGKTSDATFNNEESILDLVKGLLESLEPHNFTDEVMTDVAVLGAKPVKVDEIEEARRIATEYAKNASKNRTTEKE